MTELVHLAVADGVATITLDSPANRNALSGGLRRELLAHLDTAIADEAARVIVLTHSGPVFCSGMDLKESRGAGAQDQGVNEFPAILERIWTSRTPVLARLAGPARAGGVGIVAACDIAVAVDTATFAFSEVRIGVIPAVISAVVLPRLTSRAAAELYLTGATFDGSRAERIGLVTAAVPAAELDEATERYVDALRLGAPGALAGAKNLLTRPSSGTLRDDLEELTEMSVSYFGSAEAIEGITAFREKRDAAWIPQS
jgi:methylglutaconyl-CoA hydratase